MLESMFTLGVNLQLNFSKTIQYSIINTVIIRITENKNTLKETANLGVYDMMIFDLISQSAFEEIS